MDERGMKWYRFLVTAGLMIGALVNALNGASFVTGRIYNTPYTTATEVYGDYPLLKICDVVYGALLIGLALYEVHARQRLLQFRRNGPETYYIFVIANVVISMIFIVASVVIGLIYGLNIINWTGILMEAIMIGGQMLLLYLSIIYFEKRRDLFLN